MEEKDCGCKNKADIYVCMETPDGKSCIRVDEVPQCFDRKVTFVDL